ncbi:MAG: glycoside hydrolase family 30 beta sandwich domain-containing protein [Luteolibacter sp.]
MSSSTSPSNADLLATIQDPGFRVARWISSDGSTNWKDEHAPVLQTDDGETRHVIDLETTDLGQIIDGFGGCFNERGWDSLESLDEECREKILMDLFAQDGDGCRFTMARTPIGASDYAMDWYSLAETPEDFELKDFSIARDRRYLIPFIKAALRHFPDLHLWASPWCPPAWMKINGRYDFKGGVEVCHIRQEPKILETYARYFARYIDAYRAENINIQAVHVQNEPASGQVFPSCEWSGEELLDFLKNHLIPHFLNEGIETEIWLGTINHGDVRTYASKVLADPYVREHLTGIGYQWDGKHAIADTAELFPDMKLMQTESECGNGSNDKAAGFYTYGLLCHYLKAGANSYVYWNMVLDKGGYSTWSWEQNSLVTVDRKLPEVTYNFEYHVIRHLSRFVRPGARRLLTKGKDDDTLAFLNPDGSMIVVVRNPRYTPMQLKFRIGVKMFSASLPPESLHTFVLPSSS